MVQEVLTFPAHSGCFLCSLGWWTLWVLLSSRQQARRRQQKPWTIVHFQYWGLFWPLLFFLKLYRKQSQRLFLQQENSEPASSGADAPGGASLQGEEGRSVKMHMSLSWEKKPRRHWPAYSNGIGKGNSTWTTSAPFWSSACSCAVMPGSHGWLRGCTGHSCHSRTTAHGQGGLLSHPMGEDSVPAIPHLRAVKMPLWESKRKIKGRPEQGIALSEVTTFIVTFVLHRLVHHRVFFIPSSFSWWCSFILFDGSSPSCSISFISWNTAQGYIVFSC